MRIHAPKFIGLNFLGVFNACDQTFQPLLKFVSLSKPKLQIIEYGLEADYYYNL